MKKIYFVRVQGVGEAQGFFSEDGEYLAGWDCNDGYWHTEYMNPLITALGFEIISSESVELETRLAKI